MNFNYINQWFKIFIKICLWGMAFSFIQAEYMDKNEIHHKNDDLIRQYYGKNKHQAIKEMKQLCYSHGSHKKRMREYYCYNAAIFEHSRKQYKTAKLLLQRAMQLNPYFAEALNLYKNLYPRAYTPYIKKKGIYYYEKAVKKAKINSRRKDVIRLKLNSILKNLLLSKKLGFLKREMLNNPVFRKFRKYSAFKSFQKRLKTSRYQVNRLVKAGQKTNRLFEVLDTTYTYAVYKKYKNSKKIMYLYFRALDYMKANEKEKSSELLEKFMSKIITISHKKKKKYEYLPIYALLFIKSQKYFKNPIKDDSSFKWIKHIAEKYSIDI